jgi:hypothetical protein
MWARKVGGATVIEARLKCKTLEAKLELLQSKINEEGVDVSESLENDLLKIMGGGKIWKLHVSHT